MTLAGAVLLLTLGLDPASSIAADVPTDLREAIVALAIDATVRPRPPAGDICVPEGGGHPGYVAADFNGDGRKDYAAILEGRVIKRVERIGNWEWPVRDYWFVIFLGEADRRFRPTVLDRWESTPTDRYLQLQPAGIVLEFSADVDELAVVVLKHPGVVEIVCEKAATTYFWDDATGSFRSLITGD